MNKSGENVCGDSFCSKRVDSENRLISVLSDGLGSGVKANILSEMTSRMAMKFMEANHDLFETFEIIMQALPVCRERMISYSTFTVVDSVINGKTRVIEQGNPAYIFFRGSEKINIKKRVYTSEKWKNRDLSISEFEVYENSRIIVFSDGITQAGLGTEKYKLGWRLSGCEEFAANLIKENPEISAGQLAEKIVCEASCKEPNRKSADDMTCAVFYFRKPRTLLAVTGPPFDLQKDQLISEMIDTFKGTTLICGGTTANIVARELERDISTDLKQKRGDLPPVSTIEGVDLVTEGILTLTRVVEYLKIRGIKRPENAASKVVNAFLDSDCIDFVVGTRVNEAHQDPSLPIEIEIRRNIIKKIAKLLSINYMKEVSIKYI